MALRLKYDGPPRGKYAKDVQAWQQPLAKAATGAFREAARRIQDKGRAEIARAGFSKRWQNGFRVIVSPKQFSLSPTLRGRHQIGYANIFERGGTIRGKPLLWLPLPTAPQRIAGKRTTPRLYQDQIGRLQFVQRAGKAPLLVGEALKAVAAGRRATVSQLRSGARNAKTRRAGGRGRKTVSVPLFVGIRSAKIPDRLNVSKVYRDVHAQLRELFREQIALQKRGP